MATNEQTPDQAPPPETELDEASIMSSLARLQELHIFVWPYLPLKLIKHTLLTMYRTAS